MQRLTGILIIVITIALTSSCGNVKNMQYVQGAFDTTRLSKIQFTDPVIQRGDLLGITLFSDDATSTAGVMAQPVMLNTQSSNSGNYGGVQAAGLGNSYLVSEDGLITLYKIGAIKVAGLTKKQLADSLANRYLSLELLKHPYVEIRFLNYKVTLVGEVGKPGTYSFPTEKINIFEAIGMAGDITVFGKRNNVMVVRETNGTRQFAQLDLSKPEVFASPYFYLQQNDLVIVDVAKNKSAVSDQVTVRNISLAATLVTALAVIYNIFK